MHPYIDKLQSKPQHIRKRILITSLVVSMSLVTCVWGYTLGYHFTSQDVAAQTESDIRPFALFSQSVSGVYQNIKASVGNIPLFNAPSAGTDRATAAPRKRIDVVPVEPDH